MRSRLLFCFIFLSACVNQKTKPPQAVTQPPQVETVTVTKEASTLELLTALKSWGKSRGGSGDCWFFSEQAIEKTTQVVLVAGDVRLGGAFSCDSALLSARLEGHSLAVRGYITEGFTTNHANILYFGAKGVIYEKGIDEMGVEVAMPAGEVLGSLLKSKDAARPVLLVFPIL